MNIIEKVARKYEEPSSVFWHADKKKKKVRKIYSKPGVGLSWKADGKYEMSFEDINTPTTGVYGSKEEARGYLSKKASIIEKIAV